MIVNSVLKNKIVFSKIHSQSLRGTMYRDSCWLVLCCIALFLKPDVVVHVRCMMSWLTSMGLNEIGKS